jgi:CBS domain-containing protein
MTGILEFLREQHPFDLLTDRERELVRSETTTKSFPAGAVVLRQDGPVSPCLFLIAGGHARFDRDTLAGRVLGEGDCFGYPSIISQAGPASTATADTPLTVHCIPAPIFQQLLQNAGFAEFFLKDLSERLRQANQGGNAGLGGELTTSLGELGLRTLVTVAPEDTVAAAARAMRDARQDAAIVAHDPPGIITDYDFQVKVLAEGLGPDTLVQQVMTRSLKTLSADLPVHSALLFMLEERIHHLPVTRDGRIVGVVSATDLLRHQTRNPLYLTRQLEHLEDPATLATYSRDAADMVERLFSGGLKVAQVGRIFASVNDTLMRRLLRLAEAEVGPPPCPYAWLVFGSEGRMEQALITDQDNALVYAGSGPANVVYFKRLAKVVVGYLLAAGFPECPGGYMATNWCKPQDEWLAIMRRWVNSPTPESLMMVGIFFDFRAVGGDLPIDALEEVVATAAENQIFMAHLARQSLGFRTPLNLFRQIQADDGMVDLKTGGIAPIVAAGRVFGIAAGTRERPTRARFEAAIGAGLIGADLGTTVIETYRFLLQLRLREQLQALKEGRSPDNRIRLQGLTSRNHRHLKDAFAVIRELQEKVAHRFRVNLLG